MEKNFFVDHTKVRPGLYKERVTFAHDWNDHFLPITIFDLRFVTPNSEVEHPLPEAAMHTIEHLGRVFLEEDETWRGEVIYFGPNGSRTGFNLLLNGRYWPEEVSAVVEEMMRHIIHFSGAIPGATPEECGNFRDHNLWAAKSAAIKYLKVLTNEEPTYDQYHYAGEPAPTE